MSTAVDRLNLAVAAHKAAEALLAAHPDVVFTSGRRGVVDQARAMSQNVVHNRRWIAETYTATAESAQLQTWVDRHPEAGTAQEIAAGLQSIMEAWSDDQRGHVSKHFSGQAFDVQPVDGPHGEAIKATIRQLPGLTKFLEKEGGLVRWHAQFG